MFRTVRKHSFLDVLSMHRTRLSNCRSQYRGGTAIEGVREKERELLGQRYSFLFFVNINYIINIAQYSSCKVRRDTKLINGETSLLQMLKTGHCPSHPVPNHPFKCQHECMNYLWMFVISYFNRHLTHFTLQRNLSMTRKMNNNTHKKAVFCILTFTKLQTILKANLYTIHVYYFLY